jgi:hypothetical protein
VAIQRYGAMGYVLGTGCLHGQNDCLADSLLQCLSVAGVLPKRLVGEQGVSERREACMSSRSHLRGHENPALHPEPWNAFLEEHTQGPHIVHHFLEHFQADILLIPVEVWIVTHSRFDAAVQDHGIKTSIPRAITRVPIVNVDPIQTGPRAELHVYNETGSGHRGLHFSPILHVPEGAQ